MGKSPVVSSYAQQALLAQQQAALAQQMQQQLHQEYAQVLESPSPKAAEEREGLPYSRKPRPVDYQPYDLKVHPNQTVVCACMCIRQGYYMW
jgi:hypothetical protein